MLKKIYKIIPYLILVCGTYFSSGSLVPMNLASNQPTTREPCPYVYNTDYVFHEAIFKLVTLQPKHTWDWSVFVTRPLYYLLALPFVKVFGIDLGGVIFNVLLHFLAIFVFYRYCLKKFSEKTALWGSWLLSTCPAIYYFSGYTQCNSFIVPSVVFMFILAEKLNSDDQPGIYQQLLYPLAIGTLLLGYDLVFYFIPLVFLSTFFKRGWSFSLKSTLLALLPSASYLTLLRLAGGQLHKAHTEVFRNNFKAYLTPTPQYFELLFKNIYLGLLDLFPNFFFSNMMFTPLLFLGAAFMLKKQEWKEFRLERILFIIALSMFAFSQFSPTTTDPFLRHHVETGIKGNWLVRVYQPLFIAYFMIILYQFNRLDGLKLKVLNALGIIIIIGNLSIIFGTALKLPISQYAYHRFYKHGDPHRFLVNREKFGFHPIGLCKVKREE